MSAESEGQEGLLHRLTRPFWYEPIHEVRRRWFRLLILAPFGVIMGVAFGVYGGDLVGVSALFLSLFGAAAAVLLLYLVTHLESWIRLHVGAQAGWRSGLLRVSADLVGGALLGHFLGRALDTHVLAGLAGGGAMLAGYSHLVTSLLLDDSVDSIFRVLTGQRAGRRKPDYSYETSLAARGRIDEALVAYEEAATEYPSDPVPLLRAARLLREHDRDDEALDRYVRALDAADMEPRQAVSALLQIREIALLLDEPGRTGAALETVTEQFPDAEPPAWLVEEVREAGEAARIRPSQEEGGRGPEGGEEPGG